MVEILALFGEREGGSGLWRLFWFWEGLLLCPAVSQPGNCFKQMKANRRSLYIQDPSHPNQGLHWSETPIVHTAEQTDPWTMTELVASS